MIYAAIGLGVFGAIVVGLLVYGLVTRDKCALPGITVFDRGRLPLHLLVDHSFGLRFRQALTEAVELLNGRLGATWVVYPGATGEGGSLVPVDPYNGGAEDSKHRKAFAYAHLLVTEAGNAIAAAAVRVNTKRYDLNDLSITELRNALAHELGHCLGLAHDDLADSIMHPNARVGMSMDATLTDNDVEFLRDAYDERRNHKPATV